MSKDYITVGAHKRAFPKRKFADGGMSAAGRMADGGGVTSEREHDYLPGDLPGNTVQEAYAKPPALAAVGAKAGNSPAAPGPLNWKSIAQDAMAGGSSGVNQLAGVAGGLLGRWLKGRKADKDQSAMNEQLKSLPVHSNLPGAGFVLPVGDDRDDDGVTDDMGGDSNRGMADGGSVSPSSGQRMRRSRPMRPGGPGQGMAPSLGAAPTDAPSWGPPSGGPPPGGGSLGPMAGGQSWGPPAGGGPGGGSIGPMTGPPPGPPPGAGGMGPMAGGPPPGPPPGGPPPGGPPQGLSSDQQAQWARMNEPAKAWGPPITDSLPMSGGVGRGGPPVTAGPPGPGALPPGGGSIGPMAGGPPPGGGLIGSMAGRAPSGPPPGPPPGPPQGAGTMTPMNASQGDMQGAMQQAMQRAQQAGPPVTSANSGWTAPTAPPGFVNPKPTAEQLAALDSPENRAAHAAGFTGAMAKGGAVNADGDGPAAKGKRQRQWGDAGKPAEDLPPIVEKKAKGGVIKRRPTGKKKLAAGEKLPVPVMTTADPEPSVPPVALAAPSPVTPPPVPAMAKGGACKEMAKGGAAKVRRGFPKVKKMATGGSVRGCGAATKGKGFSGIY